MRKLTRTDRWTLVIIQFISVAVMITGSIKLATDGFSQLAAASVVTAGSMTMMISVGFIASKYSSDTEEVSPTTTLSPSVFSDPPPKYRQTWRREFISNCPEHLKVDLEMNSGTRRGDIPQIWTSGTDVNPLRPSSLSAFSSSPDPSMERASYSQGTTNLSPVEESQNVDKFSNVNKILVFPVRNFSAARYSTSSSVEITPDVDPGRNDAGLPSYEDVQRW